MKSKKTQITHVRNENISDIFADTEYLKVDYECLFQQSYANNLIGKEKSLGKSNETSDSRRNRVLGAQGLVTCLAYMRTGVHPGGNVEKKRRRGRKKGKGQGEEQGGKLLIY